MRAVPLLLLSGMACSGAAKDSGPDTADVPLDLAAYLTAPGPYGVGYAVSDFRYPDPTGEGDRTLHLATWYPSTDATADAEIRYRVAFLRVVPSRERRGRMAPSRLPSSVMVTRALRRPRAFLMGHLASHGWLVVAPDHTGNTTFDSADRETPIYYQRPRRQRTRPCAGMAGSGCRSRRGHGAQFRWVHAVRGCRCPVRRGRDLGVSRRHRHHGVLLDDERQRGGASPVRILRAAGRRVDGACSRGPAPLWRLRSVRAFGARPVDDGRVDPRTGADAAPYWAALDRGENRHVSIIGGGHQTFTDFSGTLENPEGLIPAEDGFPIVEGHVLAFARRHGLGDTRMQPALDGDVTWSDAAVLVD